MLRKTGTKLAIVFLTLTFIFWLTSMVTPGWIIISKNTSKDHVDVSFNELSLGIISAFFLLPQTFFFSKCLSSLSPKELYSKLN